MLPTLMILFAIGLSIVAGVDLSSSLVHGVLATRRALSTPLAERTRTAAVAVIIKSWLPLLWLCTACVASVFLLLAHVHVLSEIAPSLRTSLLEMATPGLEPAIMLQEPKRLQSESSRSRTVLGHVGVGKDQKSVTDRNLSPSSFTFPRDVTTSLRRSNSASKKVPQSGANLAGNIDKIAPKLTEDSATMLSSSAGGGLPAWAFDVSEPFAIANGYGLFRRYLHMYIVMCLS
jgi:hypothetical protein